MLPHLSEAGYSCTVYPPPAAARWPSSLAYWPSVLLEARRADVVLLQKRLLPRGLARALAVTGTPLVFDFDDALFARSGGGQASAKDTVRLKTVLRLSRLCTAGNDYLADWARAYCGRVEIIPTGINTTRWHPRLRREHPGLVLGWAGTSGNLVHLQAIAPAIADVQRENPAIRLVVVSDRNPNLDGVRHEFRSWRLESEIDDLTDVDVGLMPLSDDAWTRGKCGFKAIQFMALGVPVIASPVGVNARIVRNRANGLTARTTPDWVSAIRAIALNPSERHDMGRQARATIVQHYDSRQIAGQLATALDSALA